MHYFIKCVVYIIFIAFFAINTLNCVFIKCNLYGLMHSYLVIMGTIVVSRHNYIKTLAFVDGRLALQQMFTTDKYVRETEWQPCYYIDYIILIWSKTKSYLIWVSGDDKAWCNMHHRAPDSRFLLHFGPKWCNERSSYCISMVRLMV